MLQRRACVLLLAAITWGCAGVQAQSDFDPNARFDTYRSFAWIGEEPGTLSGDPGSAGHGVDPLLQRRIRAAIESQLEAKGYRKLDDRGAADFAVSFSVGAREKLQVQSVPTGGWYGRYGGWYATSGVSARSYTEGTLAIDVFDVKSRQAVWHGWATQRVDDRSDRAALVDETVSAILAKFPPPR